MHGNGVIAMEGSIKASAVVDLKSEQGKTLSSSRRKAGLLAKALFWGMDIIYGRKRTLSKFKVLEVPIGTMAGIAEASTVEPVNLKQTASNPV